MVKEYSLYKGEKEIAFGTIKDIAKKMKVKERTIRFYMTPSHNKRIKKNGRILVKLD